MATTSFSATATTSWAAIVVGSAYSSCQLQASSAVAIAAGTSLPAAAATDYFVIDGGPPLPITIANGDTIYARSLSGSAVVRGIRISV